MTYQTKPIEIEIAEQYEFPETDARPTTSMLRMNGWIIEYIDFKNRPQAVFAPRKVNELANDWFERNYGHDCTEVINRKPGIWDYDF